jgi:hypothetical protein
MKSASLRLATALALTVFGSACSDLANALTQPTGGSGDPTPQSSYATVTFWTSDPSPSYISVAVDGTTIGVLSEYRLSPPTCGVSSSGGAITVTVPAGSHVMSAYEISSTGHWGPANFTVNPGSCTTYALNP